MAKRIRKRGELRVERATYPDGNGGRAKTAKYYGWYRDLRGRRSRIALTDDRGNSLCALRALVDALKTASAGSVVQPGELPPVVRKRFYQDMKRAGHKAAEVANPKTLWADYMGDFETMLRSERCVDDYVANVICYVREVGDGCEFLSVRDFDNAGAIKRFLSRRINGGMGLEVANHRIRAVRRFCLWAYKDRNILTGYPLKDLSMFNAAEDRRRERRALMPDEVIKLIRTTAGGPTRRRFSGRERALIYQVALETGLRRSEIQALRWRCFDLSTDEPTVNIEAKNAKNRDADILPLRPALATKLAAWRTSCDGGPDDHAFTQAASWRDTHIIIAQDLAAAGIPAGRTILDGGVKRRVDVVDFHSLRTSFITGLCRGGVHPRKAQQLARHSSIDLTMNVYTNLRTTELASAVAVLPDPDAPAERAVGTG